MGLMMLMQDALAGKPLVQRSPRWPWIRKEWLVTHPRCAVCGGTTSLNVHHIAPFHLFPKLELEPTNFITLCEKSERNINCHYVVGHLGLSWKDFNPNVLQDAIYLYKMFTVRGIQNG